MGSPHWSYLLINHTIFPPCLFQWQHFAAAAPYKSLHSLTSSAAFVEHLNKAWWCQRAGFNKVSFSEKHLSMFLTFNALTCAQQGMSSKLSKGFGTSWTWSLGAWPCAAWPSMSEWEPGQGRGVNTPVPLHWQGMSRNSGSALPPPRCRNMHFVLPPGPWVQGCEKWTRAEQCRPCSSWLRESQSVATPTPSPHVLLLASGCYCREMEKTCSGTRAAWWSRFPTDQPSHGNQ